MGTNKKNGLFGGYVFWMYITGHKGGHKYLYTLFLFYNVNKLFVSVIYLNSKKIYNLNKLIWLVKIGSRDTIIQSYPQLSIFHISVCTFIDITSLVCYRFRIINTRDSFHHIDVLLRLRHPMHSTRFPGRFNLFQWPTGSLLVSLLP